MMLTQNAPLRLMKARKEVLRALASSDQTMADRHCRRAAALMNTALDEIHSHPRAHFDWSKLRAGHD